VASGSLISPVSCLEEESEPKPITLLNHIANEECPILQQSDNLPKVLILKAYCPRIIASLRKKSIPNWISAPTTDETVRALRSLILWTQQGFFSILRKYLPLITVRLSKMAHTLFKQR